MTALEPGSAIFFLQLAILSISARAGGEWASRLRLPVVIGEVMVGIILGPTVLRHLLPNLQAELFPSSGTNAIALGAVATLGISLFLFSAGLEVDLILGPSILGQLLPQIQTELFPSSGINYSPLLLPPRDRHGFGSGPASASLFLFLGGCAFGSPDEHCEFASTEVKTVENDVHEDRISRRCSRTVPLNPNSSVQQTEFPLLFFQTVEMQDTKSTKET